MLEIVNIRKTYPGKNGPITALSDFTLTVGPGEFYSVVGPSGCGKTTLLLVSGGLLHPDQGTVRIADMDLYAMDREERARFRAKQIGFVFQQFHLIPYLNVLENVLASTLAVAVPAARERALGLLEQFGLSHRLQHLPSQLSTGERQRTALARALLHRPSVLLADEPTGNLDDENGKLVLAHLADYAREGGSVLLVTHDSRAAQYTQKTINLGGLIPA